MGGPATNVATELTYGGVRRPGDDALHDGMADHIGLAEFDEFDALDAGEDTSWPPCSPDFAGGRRSICEGSPVITQRDSSPRRVRNMNICSQVVFWASSRMMYAWFKVRPRM